MSYFMFPFTTCEKPVENHIVMQPISTLINTVTCIILLIYAFYAKTYPVMFMFISYFIFELWHTFSHIHHMSGYFQANIVHILSYFLSISTLLSVSYLSGQQIPLYFLCIIILMFLFDIYIWKYVGGIWSVTFSLLILTIIVVSSYKVLPRYFQKSLVWLVFGLLIMLLLMYNESVNCNKMLSIAILPYHAIIEMIGLLLFTVLSYNFIRWEQQIL